MDLSAALEAWRAARTAANAKLVEAAAAAIARPSITGKSLAVRLEAWAKIAAAKDPADVARLAVEPPPKKFDQAKIIVDGLCAFDDDPRIAEALTSYIERNAVTTDAGIGLIDQALRRIAQIRDARVLPRIEALLALKKRPQMHPEFGNTIAALRALPVDESPATPTNGDALLEAIYAAPDDREAIAVYGDWLVQQHDPRSELVLGTATPAREKKLLAEHGVKWAGALGKWFRTEDRRWARGFFVGGKLRDGYVDEIVGTPGWPMIRILEVGPSLEQLAGKLIEHLPVLEAIGVVTEPFAASLESQTLRELHWIVRDCTGCEFAMLPALRTVAPWAAPEEILPWLESAPVVERLEKVILTAPSAETVQAVFARKGVGEIELGHGRFGKQTGWNIRLSRGGEIVAKWSGAKNEMQQFTYTLTQSLAAIPTTLGRSIAFEVTAKLELPADQIALLDAAVDRFGATARPWR